MTKANKDSKKITCSICKKNLVETNFYKSKSPLFPNGRVNICKKCIMKMIDYTDMETIFTIFRSLDIPYIHKRWVEVCKKNPKNPFGHYIREANSGLNDFAGSRWKDSKFKDQVQDSKEDDCNEISHLNKNKKPNFTFDDISNDQLREKWGYLHSDEELFYFEKKYRKLIDGYSEKSSIHTENLLTYVRFRVKEEMATAKGDSVQAKNWGGLAETAAKSAKITVQQLSKSDISGGVDLMPQLFEAVEDKVGIISIMPKLKAQPYDDADLIIWAIINYLQRLEGKPPIEYEEIYKFYDGMLMEYFEQNGYSKERIEEERKKRNAIFRDLSKVYIEPIYKDEDI